MIPRFAPNYDWNELLACFLPADPKAVSRFEMKMAKKSGHAHAISFRYGRAGLFYLLKALGAQGKKVILPSYTCIVVAHAIVLSGNIPVFLDNVLGSLQPNPEDYLKAIDFDTIMVIPTHLFGIAEETEDLYHIIKHKFPHVVVLQDCAHSFFCEDEKGKIVTLHGDGALYGMNISKLINTGFGGMLTLRDKELARKVRDLVKLDRKEQQRKSSLFTRVYVFLATIAFSRLFYRVVYFLTHKTTFLKRYTDYYNPSTIELPKDFFYSVLSFEATIGLKSLAKYNERIRERRKIAQFYWENLVNVPHVKLPPFKKGNTWSHFPLLVPAALRETIVSQLEKSCGVEIGKIVDYSIADLPAYQKLGHKGCPVSRDAAVGIVNLPLCLREGLIPLSHQVTRKYLINIIQTIQLVLSKYAEGTKTA